jgi:hypothetical protein
MFKLINSKIKLFGKVLLLGNGVPPTTEPPTTEPPTTEPPTTEPPTTEPPTTEPPTTEPPTTEPPTTEDPVIALADAWGLTHDGQYESSGRWYLDGILVNGNGTDWENAVNTAADDADTDGQYGSTGRWYYYGTFLPGGEESYGTAEADAWGASNDGQYESSDRWYLNGSNIANNEASWIVAVNNAATTAGTNGQYGSTGRYYINGSYAECYDNPSQGEIDDALEAWKSEATGLSGAVYYTRNQMTCEWSFMTSQTVSQEPLTNRYVFENEIYYSGQDYEDAVAASTPCTPLTQEQVNSAAQTWSQDTANSGEFKYSQSSPPSCAAVYDAGGTSSGKYAFGGSLYTSQSEYNDAVAAAAALVIAADNWGSTQVNGEYPSGQYQSSGRYYHGGNYIGDQAAYDQFIAELTTAPPTTEPPTTEPPTTEPSSTEPPTTEPSSTEPPTTEPPTTEPPTTEPPTSDEPPSGESTTGPDPYLAFLSGNVGVNQYTGPGAMNGTWAWSHNGGYASEEAATAAMNAAEG